MQTSPSEPEKPRCPKYISTGVPCPYVIDESGMCPMHAFKAGAYARQDSFAMQLVPKKVHTPRHEDEDEEDDDEHN